MTKAEFEFKLSIGCQLFYSKFKCNPDVVYIDSATHTNLLHNGYTNDTYPYEYNGYTVFMYIQINVQDYLKLYNRNGKALNLLGEH